MQAVAYDESRDINALLKKHRSEIDALRKLTQEQLGPAHDDIFLLRYILSYGSAKAAKDAVVFTIEWRSDPVNKFFLDRLAQNGEIPMLKDMEKLGLRVGAIHRLTALDGGPVQLVRQGLIDMEPMLTSYTHEEMVRFNNLMKEEAWIICDRVTRETGRLVKLLVINDFTGMPMRRPPSAWMSAFQESSKLAEKVYPQLLECNAMCNTPGWFSWLMAIVKLFLSKKTLEKMRMCRGGDTRTGDVSTCPYIMGKVARDSLPSYLGGTCNCPGGCVPGMPNDPVGPVPRRITDEEVTKLKALQEEGRRRDEEELKKLPKKK